MKSKSRARIAPAPGRYWYFGSCRNLTTGEAFRTGPEIVMVSESGRVSGLTWSNSRKTWEAVAPPLPDIFLPLGAPILTPSGVVDWTPVLAPIFESLKDPARALYEGDTCGVWSAMRTQVRATLKDLKVDGLGGCPLCCS